MPPRKKRHAPGEIRDAVLAALKQNTGALQVREIHQEVNARVGDVPASSIRSYLRLNTPGLFVREEKGTYRVRAEATNVGAQKTIPSLREPMRSFKTGKAQLFLGDCFDWLEARSPNSVQAVVTDPPYGLMEYSAEQQAKLRAGRGGVWRIPPSFDGHQRSPLPRFTTLGPSELSTLEQFFRTWARLLGRVLVPGANVLVASNPLLSHIVSTALAAGGLERRGELIRLVMTMRGGDRPKAAHEEFSGVSVMPRSMWEPWLIFRKPIEGRVQDNLRKWKTGGFRRPSSDKPFGDVIESAPTRREERAIAPHPSLKPQQFMRPVVRAVLPLGEGVVLDPFAGSGATLAAAEKWGYESIGIERDPAYLNLARTAIPRLAAYQTR